MYTSHRVGIPNPMPKVTLYIAVAKNGNYEVVTQSKGLVDPKEC